MAWSVTLNGTTWTNADFDGQAYVDSWPEFWADMAAVADGIAAAAGAGGAFLANVSISASSVSLAITDTASYASGVGGIIELDFMNLSSVQKVGARIEAVGVTGTNGAENADCVISAIRAGTVTEVGRFLGTGGNNGVNLSTFKSGQVAQFGRTSTTYLVSAINLSDGANCGIGLFAKHSSTAATIQNDATGVKGVYLSYDGSVLKWTFNGVATASADFSSTVDGLKQFVTGGVNIGSPTGGDKGLGTLNAVGVYDDNVLLTCYVFDAALDGGKIDLAKWDAKVPDRVHRETVVVAGESIERDRVEVRQHDPLRMFAERIGGEYDPLDLGAYTRHWRDKRHLTSMPNEEKYDPEVGMPTGAWIQRLIETAEIHAVHLGQVNDRLKALGG